MEASLGIYFWVRIRTANQRGFIGYLFLRKHQFRESARHHGVSFYSVTSYQRISKASWGLFFFGNIKSANQRGILGSLFSVTSNKRISEASLGIYFCVSIKSANQRGIIGIILLRNYFVSESAMEQCLFPFDIVLLFFSVVYV